MKISQSLMTLAALILSTMSALAQVTVEYQPTPYPSTVTNGVHVIDGWLPSVFYGKTFQQNEMLQSGGWGDRYRTYIQFDLEGLPEVVSSAELSLYAFPRPAGTPQVNFDLRRPNSVWTTAMTWSTQPTSFTTVISNYPYNPVNTFWDIDITSTYNGWQGNTIDNYGLMLDPRLTNNKWDVWRSSRYLDDDTKRPMLRLTFTPPVTVPNFIMPLPNDAEWLVTTEVGGWDCKGGDAEGKKDPAHADENYFSIDFAWANRDVNGASLYGDPDNGAMIPVTPAADGRVVAIGDDSQWNGHFIVISHDPSYDVETGFSTRYLHLKEAPLVNVDDDVVAGVTVLGYMGSTGKSTNPHLHFGVRYEDSGASDTNVRYATLNGLLLKSYQSECVDDTWTRYYGLD